MSYSPEITALELRRKDLLTKLNQVSEASEKTKYRTSLDLVEEQIKRLRRLEWEDSHERLDLSEDR
jgi:hypothetical protein